MSGKVYTLAEVAEKQIVPLGRSTLYRAAEEGNSPFRKVRGRWMAFERDLEDWVRRGDVTPPKKPRVGSAKELLGRLDDMEEQS